MATIKIFTSPTCPNCPPAKVMGEELKKQKLDVKMFNIAEADGLAEAQYCGVMSVPAIIVADKEDNEIAAWKNGLPSIEEVVKKTK